ncbi:MAG: hypothetical protein C5B57_07735 [Blastocatellia bacterium]|nr:MAG: hypothetical protein C5B57_07735 [Blastocatellia bacterium]
MGRMRFLGIPVLVFVFLAGPHGARPAAAQAKEARGTVTAVSDSSLTVKVGTQDMTFQVDKGTVVEAKGAGRRTREAGQAGATGPTVSEFVKPGGAVVVTYTATGGTNHADRVRPVSTAGSPPSSAPAAPPTKTATGKVKSVTATALTVTGDAGKDMTFSVDPSTRVLAKGAGKATTAAGGRISVTDLVKSGDTVSVSYTDAGGSMTAKQIRITVKAP